MLQISKHKKYLIVISFGNIVILIVLCNEYRTEIPPHIERKKQEALKRRELSPRQDSIRLITELRVKHLISFLQGEY